MAKREISGVNRNLLTGYAIRIRKITEGVRGVHNDIGLPLMLSEAIGNLDKAAFLICETAGS